MAQKKGVYWLLSAIVIGRKSARGQVACARTIMSWIAALCAFRARTIKFCKP